MKRVVKITLIIAAFLAVIAQFVRPDLTNPPTEAGQSLEATMEVPTGVAGILRRSCNDCHTNATSYPWYSQITPISWWLKNHVENGREHLNFSTWNAYETSRKIRKLDEICSEVESRGMPLPSYTWAHRDAPLSYAEIKMLCDWANAERDRLETASE